MIWRKVTPFKWEIPENMENRMESEFLKFDIKIESKYKWGFGWTSSDSEKFYSQVLDGLRKAGFSIEEKRDDLSCPIIKGKGSFDKTYAYLHPMEFTGYAKEKDIQKILDVLEHCDRDVVESAYISKKSIVSELSDFDYKKLLIKNTSKIAKWQDEMVASGCYERELGMEFAKEYRIPRVGDKSGCLSSGDVDVEFVEQLYQIRKELKKDKDLDLEEEGFDR